MITSRQVFFVAFIVVVIAYFRSRKSSALSLYESDEPLRSAASCGCKDCPAKSSISLMQEGIAEDEEEETVALETRTRETPLGRLAYTQ